MLVLDTDLLTILVRGPELERVRLLARLDAAGDEQAAVTIVSFEEQMRGWLSVIAKAKTVEQQAAGYPRLAQLLADFGRFPVLAFDVAAARRFSALRRQYRRHGAADLKIASIALENNAILLSRNLRHFLPFHGLSVENPLA